MEMTETTRAQTSARIYVDTAEMLAEHRRRLSLLAARDLTTDEVIKVMHRVFSQQPEAVIRAAVQS